MTTVFAVGAVIVCLLQVCLCLSLDEAIMTTVFAVGAVIVCLLQVCLCLITLATGHCSFCPINGPMWQVCTMPPTHNLEFLQ